MAAGMAPGMENPRQTSRALTRCLIPISARRAIHRLFGERVRPARSVWRLAKHIRACPRVNPVNLEKSISWISKKVGCESHPFRHKLFIINYLRKIILIFCTKATRPADKDSIGARVSVIGVGPKNKKPLLLEEAGSIIFRKQQAAESSRKALLPRV
jgi:hypothetical protein